MLQTRSTQKNFFLNSFLLYLLSTILIPFYNNWHIDNCFSFSFKLDFTLLDISQPHIKHSSIINQDIINQDDFYNSIQGVKKKNIYINIMIDWLLPLDIFSLNSRDPFRKFLIFFKLFDKYGAFGFHKYSEKFPRNYRIQIYIHHE